MSETLEGLTPKQIAAIEGLCREATIEAAASVAGVSKTTLWRWLQTEDFSRAYREARARLLDNALSQLESSAGLAIETLRDVMSNKKAQAAARVGAAKATIDALLRMRDAVQFEERLAALEARLSERRAV